MLPCTQFQITTNASNVFYFFYLNHPVTDGDSPLVDFYVAVQINVRIKSAPNEFVDA